MYKNHLLTPLKPTRRRKRNHKTNLNNPPHNNQHQQQHRNKPRNPHHRTTPNLSDWLLRLLRNPQRRLLPNRPQLRHDLMPRHRSRNLIVDHRLKRRHHRGARDGQQQQW